MFKKKEFYFLVLFIFLFTLLQFNKLNNYYNLGDDFAQYILQSKAIFDSPIKEYELQKELNSYSIIQIGPNSYPFGYPLVLKFIEFFSNGDFKYYKLANIIFFNFFIIFTYLILLKKSKLYAFLVILLFSLSDEIFILSRSIESDLMFGLFCVMAIYFFDEGKYSWALITCLFTLLIKLQGVILLFVLTFLFFKNNTLNRFKNFYIVFFLSYLIVYLSKFRFLLGEYKDHFKLFSPYFSNLNYNLETIAISFLPDLINYQFTSFMILIILIFVLIKVIKNQNFSIHYLVFLSYFLFFSIYLGQQGIRFLLVILPSIFIIIFELLDSKRFKNTFAICIVCLLIILNLQEPFKADYQDNAFGRSYSKLYSFIIENVDDEDYIAFEKPRLLRLATNKKGVFLDHSSLLNEPLYVVTKKEKSEIFYKELKSYSIFKQIDNFFIYKLNQNN